MRERRDATDPRELGLPVGARRRAKGLRRTELAQLADISVEYLTRIEQGRDRNPSQPVVLAIGRGLGLDRAGMAQLRHLAKIASGGCPTQGEPLPTTVRPTVLAVLASLEPALAVVTNRDGAWLAHTSSFAVVAEACGLVTDDPHDRDRFVLGDETLAATEGADAASRTNCRLSMQLLPHHVVLQLAAPESGELSFEREVLDLLAGDAQQLVVLVPTDRATEERVAGLLRGAAAPLRAVR